MLRQSIFDVSTEYQHQHQHQHISRLLPVASSSTCPCPNVRARRRPFRSTVLQNAAATRRRLRPRPAAPLPHRHTCPSRTSSSPFTTASSRTSLALCPYLYQGPCPHRCRRPHRPLVSRRLAAPHRPNHRNLRSVTTRTSCATTAYTSATAES